MCDLAMYNYIEVLLHFKKSINHNSEDLDEGSSEQEIFPVPQKA